MKDMSKYQGIFPAFYACYDESGAISPDAVRALTQHFIEKGVQGLYVGGSSGECIYHSVAERKVVLENVMAVAKGKLTIIAHVACNNTADSRELAAHAESLGVDAIAAIPPHLLPPAGARHCKVLERHLRSRPQHGFCHLQHPPAGRRGPHHVPAERDAENPRVIGVKNSSMPVQDIQMFHDEGAIVFNGPDEQLLSGLAAGAIGGIGGTYGAMPELYLKIRELFLEGKMEQAREIQNECCRIIYKMCSAKGNMYAVIKAILRKQGGPDCGGVRLPLAALTEADQAVVDESAAMIQAAITKYC